MGTREHGEWTPYNMLAWQYRVLKRTVGGISGPRWTPTAMVR